MIFSAVGGEQEIREDFTSVWDLAPQQQFDAIENR